MSRQDASLHSYGNCMHGYTMRTTSACELWCWMSSFSRCFAFYDAVFTLEMFFLIAKLQHDVERQEDSTSSRWDGVWWICWPFQHSIILLQPFRALNINQTLMNYVAIVCLANWFLHSRVFKSLCSLIWWFDKYFIIFVLSFVSRIWSVFNWGEVKFREFLKSFFPTRKMSKWTIQHVMHHTVIQLFLKYGCFILASFILIFSLSTWESFTLLLFVMKSPRISLVKAKKKTSLMETWLIN